MLCGTGKDARQTCGRYAAIPDRTLREKLFGTTPPRGRSPTLTFMILSRIGKNTLARKGLVKKSARLSTVLTNGHRILCSSTSSRTTFDVFHPTVVLRVVGHIDGRFVVNEHVRGGIGTEP